MEICGPRALRFSIVEPAGLGARPVWVGRLGAWAFLALAGAMALAYARPLLGAQSGSRSITSRSIEIQSFDVDRQNVTVIDAATHHPVTIAKKENFGTWTLMAVIERSEGSLAVFEELKDRQGSILYVGKRGAVLNLPKTLEPSSAAPSTLYRGRTQEEIAKSQQDILGEELLSGTA
ncbi:MAG TPA: hypothetical protein VJS37_02900, partial [Terriglobales bacterium]|nr:hypothetical protein [Terriglobales bacterium]